MTRHKRRAALALAALLASPSDARQGFREAGTSAVANLLATFYREGKWRWATTLPTATNQDHGDDALTTVLYLRWTGTHDPSLVPIFAALARTAVTYGPPCRAAKCSEWSDYPLWDSVAASETWAVTGDPKALSNARAGYAAVAGSNAYALGACPEILYQQPFGGAATYRLKTLETDANLVKAALLLWRETREPAYLVDARAHYAAIESRYRDAEVPLYTTYVFDDGARCTPLPHRFYASVNGLMIWNGLALARATGDAAYRARAVDTARAVAALLADGRGVFADLQAENDVVAPLVEAMFTLAREGGDGSADARRWIVRNAAASTCNRHADGSFGRFFGGPATSATTTSLQANGGYALAVAAAALAPRKRAEPGGWANARFVAADARGFPARFAFTAARVAVIGTIGEACCEPGHARVFVDGVETFDRRGIWQNKSNTGLTMPGSVLFAWGWRTPGPHRLDFLPGKPNGKEGGPFLHIAGFLLADEAGGGASAVSSRTIGGSAARDGD